MKQRGFTEKEAECYQEFIDSEFSSSDSPAGYLPEGWKAIRFGKSRPGISIETPSGGGVSVYDPSIVMGQSIAADVLYLLLDKMLGK